MLSHLAKRILLKPDVRGTGHLDGPVSGFYFLAALHHVRHGAEVLIDWEDQYILLELGPSVVLGAYCKADAFQFGKLLAELAHVDPKAIDDAYQKVMPKDQLEDEPASQHRTPPSQRIGSLLVSAHLISPHMIGTVLRAQIIERTLRLLSLESGHYTFEPKSAHEGNEPLYPYLNPTVGTDELLFHGLMWRSSMRVVNALVEEWLALDLHIRFPDDFSIPDHLAVICRMPAKKLMQQKFTQLLGREVSFEAWVSENDKAFHRRFVLACMFVFAQHCHR